VCAGITTKYFFNYFPSTSNQSQQRGMYRIAHSLLLARLFMPELAHAVTHYQKLHESFILFFNCTNKKNLLVVSTSPNGEVGISTAPNGEIRLSTSPNWRNHE